MKSNIPQGILLLMFMLGFNSINAQQITVDFAGELIGEVGDEVTLKVEVSDLTGLDIPNFDIRFSFDSDLIFFETDKIKAGDLINTLTSNVTDDDRILVSYASSSPITGEGVLFEVTGLLIGDGTNEAGMIVTELFFGDGSRNVSPEIPYEIPVRSGDYETKLLPPSLISPQDRSSNLSGLLTFEWSDGEGAESYQFMLSRDSFFTDILVDTANIEDTTTRLEKDLEEGSEYFWRVRSTAGNNESDWSHGFSFTTQVATSTETVLDHPKSFSLGANYPNPFNPSTSLTYNLPENSEVQVELFNMSGQKLAVLEKGMKFGGKHSLRADLSDYASGTYIIRLKAVSGSNRFTAIEKVTLIK